ncbi:Rrf2 family protein [Deinobacterium chartae]|uniref:Rrf2 family protein n=1 Tax=Deinobacterium chartae TaxID=521158 RepID=A0A841I4W8_9DEIO|nr:Rrf2 family transcriptional regulator [Deinobacterium chartae]MBB6099470.1 Rrf2 family protein [Deinobacterium chartae]
MNSQYAIAVHVLSLISLYPNSAASSEDIAASVGVHPVIVRNVSGMLRRAGLLQTQQGVAGARLTRKPEHITLLEVYRAVGGPNSVFRLHERPNPNCPVGAHIQTTLEDVFADAQAALEARLASVTLHDVASRIVQRAG